MRRAKPPPPLRTRVSDGRVAADAVTDEHVSRRPRSVSDVASGLESGGSRENHSRLLPRPPRARQRVNSVGGVGDEGEAPSRRPGSAAWDALRPPRRRRSAPYSSLIDHTASVRCTPRPALVASRRARTTFVTASRTRQDERRPTAPPGSRPCSRNRPRVWRRGPMASGVARCDSVRGAARARTATTGKWPTWNATDYRHWRWKTVTCAFVSGSEPQ